MEYKEKVAQYTVWHKFSKSRGWSLHSSFYKLIDAQTELSTLEFNKDDNEDYKIVDQGGEFYITRSALL